MKRQIFVYLTNYNRFVFDHMACFTTNSERKCEAQSGIAVNESKMIFLATFFQNIFLILMIVREKKNCLFF